MCLVGGVLVGFYTQTIMTENMGLIDFYIITPVTIFLYYGSLIGFTTASGCFAGSGGRWWWTGFVSETIPRN
jgi:hypothetical protein